MSFGKTGRRACRAAAAVGAGALMLGLGGCGQFGDPLDALGASIPPPDEFQVMRYEPLVVPGSYTLPEPQPGAASPRAPRPNEAAIAALLGPEAAQAAAAEPSPGEQALLSSAAATTAAPEIRVQLEEDKRQAAASKAYEPPTIWELFGFGGDGESDEAELIDPLTEAERLQAEGILTPVDPEAAARAPEEETAPEETPEPIDRRPTNRLGPPPEPAFE